MELVRGTTRTSRILDRNLELHAVGLVVGHDGEDGLEVSDLLHTDGVLLQGGDDGGVNVLLEVLTLVGDLTAVGALRLGGLHGLLGALLGGLLVLITHEVLLALGLLLGGGALEEVVGDLGGVDGGDVNLGAGGDHVAGVDTTEGDTVVLEGTGHDEGTVLGELLEDNNTATAEATGQHDDDGTGGDGLAQGGELVVGALDGLDDLLAGALGTSLLDGLGGGGHFYQ
eukprot:356427_1